MRLTLDEYAKHFKMSKEMINSKLRAKKLNYIIENSTTYIIVPKNNLSEHRVKSLQTVPTPPAKQVKTPTQNVHTTLQVKSKNSVTKPKTTVAMVLGLYQKENQQLKEKVITLEAKIDKLIADKEQMLRDEISKIEQVYSKKDEQLKIILELINTKLTQENNPEHTTVHDVQQVEPQTKQEVPTFQQETLVELKNYLRDTNLQSYQKKMIKKRFLSVKDEDIRVIMQDGKIFLNFSKYDYSDLLEY